MRTHLPRVMLVCLALLLVLGTPGVAAAKYEIELHRRSFVPTAELAPELLSRVEDSHVVLQFEEIPTPERREELRAAGITLLDYVPNYAWTAAVKGGALSALGAGEVRAVFDLTPDDKIARTAIDQPIVRAYVYDDVEDPLAVLSAHGDIIEQDDSAFVLRLSGDLLALASEDAVKYVAGPRPEKIENNDDIRDNINADEAQAAPYNLTGAGLALGMWDNGAASTGHADYASRLTVGDGSSTGNHPTLVCGVMAGDGTRSTAYGGSPYQWRGVATEADIASYSWPDGVSNMNSEHSHAISNYDIILSQNSWSWGLCSGGCEYYGEYDDWSQNFDKLVRGSQGKRISVVFSAGNDGDCFDCSGDIPDFPYGTIPGPGSTAKNAIVVGSNDADTDNLSDFSSMGPTLDGRLKPDVAAPGCKNSAGITTTYTSNNYNSSYCGTSFSCPAVSGCVALLQEDYIDKFGGEAWPSTVKALLIQGAEDNGNVGPDYQFGFGRVNIQNTVDVVRADNGSGDLIKEDTLSPAEVWEYDVTVTPGDDLKVTLVWDDYEADYGVPGKSLVNDLDLELEAPGGTVYYPWLLDPDHPSWVATTGVDDLNNVEQVEVDSPSPGLWTIRVTATVMPEPNQDFSVVTNLGGTGEDPPPAPPTGLGAVPGTDEGEIDLDWDPNSEPDLDHYRIERDDNPSFTSPASFTTDPSSYTDSGLTPGATYWYRVFAVDAGSNESGPSNVAFSDAQDLPPSPPTSLNAWTGTGEGEIEIAWNPSPDPDVVQHRLERADNPGFSGSTSFYTVAPLYSDSGLVPGELYYYRAFAIDVGTNESGASNTDSATAQDLPPAPPTGLNAVTGVGEGEIDVTWNPNTEPDFDHYRLERCLAPDFGPGTDPFDLPEPVYHDSGLDPGETYYYRVIAVDENANESDPSGTDSATAQDLPPSPPTGLSAVTGTGEGEIDVSWIPSPEPDVVEYRIERDTNPGFGSPVSFLEVGPPFNDSGLTPGDTYYYRAFAIDAGANESGQSNTDSAQAQDLVPSAPTGLVATTGAGEGEIDVSWDPNPESDIDYYRLQRDYWPDFPDPAVTILPDTEHLEAELIPGVVYYFRVFAVDLGGNESDFSSTVSATAQDLPPAAPTGLSAVPGAGEGEIDVSWNASTEGDFDHYRLERDTDPGFGSPVSFLPGGTSFADSGLMPGTTYHYRVFAVDAGANESGPSTSDSAVATDLVPSQPTGLVAVTGTDEGEIDVTWNANPEIDIDYYRIRRDFFPHFPDPTWLTTTETYYDDSGLIPSAMYFYEVIAVDLAGHESEVSIHASATAQDLPPEPATNLVAVTGSGDGEIDVSWDASPSPDVQFYRLERDVDPGFGAPTVIQVNVGTSHTDSGLTPDDVYYYRTFAVDAGINSSDPSNTDWAAAYNAPPAPPTGLWCGTYLLDGMIRVDWDDSPEPDLDDYRLERDTDPGFPSPTSIISNTSSWFDEGLIPGDTYYYRVFARDTAGNESGASDWCSCQATDLTPEAPTGLVAVPGAAEGEIDVDWDDNAEPDISHYRVERADDPGFAGADSFTAPGSDYADSGLIPGQTYYYRVFAVDNTVHESAASGAASADATDSPPAAPTGLTAVSGPGEGEIFVSWSANGEPDLDRYRLERSTAPDFEPGSEPFETPATSYQDSDLEPGTVYYYRVIAIDLGGNESPPSDTASAAALDLAPTAPTNLDALSGPGEGEIFISWNANPEPDIDHYLWERASNPEFEPGSEPFEEPAVSYQDSGLVPGDTYYYRVSAVDATGNTSGPSEVASAVALDVAPAAPTGLAAAPSGDWDVLLTWDANSEPDLDRYRLERDVTETFGAGTVSFETTDVSHLDSGLDVGVTYYYRLFAIDTLGGESPASDTVPYLFEGTGVPEDLVASVSFVRPNPFSGEAALTYTVPSEGATVTMRVYDIRGRLVRNLLDRVHEGGAFQAIWDGRDARGEKVAAGIYFFRTAVGDLEEIRKVVLIR